MARSEVYELYVDVAGNYYAQKPGLAKQMVQCTLSSGTGTVTAAGTTAEVRGTLRELFIDENGHIYRHYAGRYTSIGSAHTPSHSIFRAYVSGTGSLLKFTKGQFLAATYNA